MMLFENQSYSMKMMYNANHKIYFSFYIYPVGVVRDGKVSRLTLLFVDAAADFTYRMNAKEKKMRAITRACVYFISHYIATAMISYPRLS